MSVPTRLPAIPEPTAENADAACLRALKEVAEVREGRRGDPLDRFVSLRELVALGVVNPATIGMAS